MPYQGMTEILSVFVEGTPIPQGSLRSGGRGQLFYSNASTLKPWRNKITKAVQTLLPDDYESYTGAVMIRVSFYMPRPKSVKRTLPTVAPDLDKLMRAVGDALTASGVYKDDSNVVEWRARKLYADTCPPGISLEIHRVDEA